MSARLNLVHVATGSRDFLTCEPTRRFWPVLQFRVSVTRADGSHSEYLRTGGSAFGHTIDAIDDAGIGGAVRVLPFVEEAA